MIAKIAHHLSNPQTTTTMPITVSTYNDNDIVTIAEARARIGTGSPGRHMFHHAVTRGDLKKSADSGPRSVKFRWGDVRAMHERGDFSKKQERGGTTSGDQTAPEVPSEDADTAVVSATDDAAATDVSDATTYRPDDVLTIAEIRQRIGGTYPTRQSVHDAIKRGDLKATPNGADKKVRLLWGEVEKFRARGGFSKRGQQSAGAPTVFSGAAPEDDLSPPAVTEPAPPDDADALDAVSVTYPAPGCECEPRPSTIVDACADPGNPGNADAAAMANSAANADDDMATPATVSPVNEACGMMVVVADPEVAEPLSADENIDPAVAGEIGGAEARLAGIGTLTEADLIGGIKHFLGRTDDLYLMTVTAGKRTMVNAWASGMLMNQAKKTVGHGKFGQWLEENILTAGLSLKSCQRYMKLAKAYPNVRSLVATRSALKDAYATCGITHDCQTVASEAPGAANAKPTDDHSRGQMLLRQLSALQSDLRSFITSGERLAEDDLNQLDLVMGELNRFHSQLHDADAQTQTRTAA